MRRLLGLAGIMVAGAALLGQTSGTGDDSLAPGLAVAEASAPDLCPGSLRYRNARNCADFATAAEAQALYLACGGLSNDVHRLDRDKDGRACEWNP